MRAELPNILETQVIEHIAHAEKLDSLRSQVPNLRVRRREATGYGFYTTFDLTEEGRATIDEGIGNRTVGKNVRAEIEGMKHEVGFVLYLEGGRIHTLEGYSVDEPWPAKVESFRLFNV